MTPAPMTPTRSDRFASALAPDADALEVILSASSSACRQPSAILPPGRPGGSPSTSPHMWRMPRDDPGHVLSQKITPPNKSPMAIKLQLPHRIKFPANREEYRDFDRFSALKSKNLC